MQKSKINVHLVHSIIHAFYLLQPKLQNNDWQICYIYKFRIHIFIQLFVFEKIITKFVFNAEFPKTHPPSWKTKRACANTSKHKHDTLTLTLTPTTTTTHLSLAARIINVIYQHTIMYANAAHKATKRWLRGCDPCVCLFVCLCMWCCDDGEPVCAQCADRACLLDRSYIYSYVYVCRTRACFHVCVVLRCFVIAVTKMHCACLAVGASAIKKKQYGGAGLKWKLCQLRTSQITRLVGIINWLETSW